jgi:LPXTG-motif cell wall-anchored protein
MKKKLSVIFCMMLLVVFALPVTAFAIGIGPVYDTSETAQLKAFLNLDSAEAGKSNGQQLNADYDENDPSTWTGVVWSDTSSPYHVTQLNWSSHSLKGDLILSDFTSLIDVYLEGNSLSSVDFSGDTALETIRLDENNLTSLDFFGLSSLDSARCAGNQLTQVNLTGCSALSNLELQENNLESIDLSDCTALNSFSIASNKLTSLDVSMVSSLYALSCDSNNLSTLTLGTQNDLFYFTCSENQLTSLDLSSCDSLEILVCNDNQLSGTLDISHLTGITALLYQNNNFTSVNLGANFTFYLFGYNNPTTEIKTQFFTEGTGTQTFSANGDGYVCLTIDLVNGEAFLYAQGLKGGAFVNYTIDGTEISTSPIHYFDIENLETDDIIANFSDALTSSNKGNIVYEGGRITITPLFTGGTWQYDKGFLSADFSDPENPVFKGLKSGKTTVSYTLPAYTYEEPMLFRIKSIEEPVVTTQDEGGDNIDMPTLPEQTFTVSMEVIVKDSALPQTGQDYTIPAIFMAIGITGIAGILLANKRKKKNV